MVATCDEIRNAYGTTVIPVAGDVTNPKDIEHLVATAVKNKGAGHHIPSGLPARRLVIRSRVELAGSGGASNEDQILGRVLTDDAGSEVPYWLATRIGSDTRLPAGQTHRSKREASAPGDGKVVVEVWWQSMSAPIAKRVGVEPERELMARVEIPFGAPSKGGKRSGLPKKVEVGP